jgi:LmbE family N-acetylglucosaminyl deacetylase
MAIISLSIKNKDKILIIAPHPDDECIGVGGIMALYPRQCEIVVLTDGREGNPAVKPENEVVIRKKQLDNEMKLIDINSCIWKGFPDGKLINFPNCVDDIKFENYTKIFLPWRDDNHVDHTAAFLYSLKRIKQVCLKDTEIYEYEVHVPFHDVTHYLDITEVNDKKMQLIQCHKDQIELLRYDKQMNSLAKYRACQLNQDSKLYETYKKVDLNEAEEDDMVEKIAGREVTITKYTQFIHLFTDWIKSYQNKKYIADWFHENNVTIYGYAHIGQLLYRELRSADINVEEILDKRELKAEAQECRIVKPQDGNKAVECVVITAIYYYDEIKKELLESGYNNILSIKDIIEEINKKNKE